MNNTDNSVPSHLVTKLAERFKTLKSRFRNGKVDTSLTLNAIQWLLDGRHFNANFLVPSPIVQLQIVKMLNHLHNLGLHNYDFKWMPVYTGHLRGFNDSTLDSPTDIAVLDIRLGSFSRTINTILKIIQNSQICRFGSEKLNLGNIGIVEENDSVYCAEVFPETYPPSSMRWRKVRFGRKSENRSVQKVRDKGEPMPSTAILWAMVYNPQIVQLLKYKYDLHSIWIPGASLEFDTYECDVLHIKFDEQGDTLEFDLANPRNEGSNRSVPEYMD